MRIEKSATMSLFARNDWMILYYYNISKYVNNQYLGLPKLVIWDFFICDNYNKPLYLGKG